MEKGERRFKKDVLMEDERVECFCIVPESEQEHHADEDKVYLKEWAEIPQQTHSLNVGIVEIAGQEFPDTDALITFMKDTPIGVVTADCVPILLHAPDISCVAAVHAGWKGTIGGIIERVLDEMERLGADPAKMTIVFGPSISKEVYEVDRVLGERFMQAGFGEYVSWPKGEEGKPHIDLQGVNMARMLRRGVLRDNIHLSEGCTYTDSRFHSYRRDGEKAGRQLTGIVKR